MNPIEFDAVLQRPQGIGTWTYVDIPADMQAAFGSKGQVKVRGSISGQPFRGLAMPHGDGTHFLVVNQGIRAALGVTQGQSVHVVLEEDAAERLVTVPDDFQQALQSDPQALAAYEKLAYSHRKQYVEWIEQARQPQTRQRRIAQALEMLPKKQSPKDRKKL